MPALMRTVADDGDDLPVLALQAARHRHAEPGRDRRRGMSGAERVVLAFGTTREAGQAAALAHGANAIAPPGEDLVRIGLMADIPDQPVARRVEHRVEGDGQLDHAERGAEVAAGDGNRIDRLGTQFCGELLQLFGRQIAQIGRVPHPVEEWSLGRYSSWTILQCAHVLERVQRAFEAAIARHLAATAGCMRGDKRFNVHVAFGFDRDEFAFGSARSLPAMPKTCARGHSSGQSIDVCKRVQS